MVAKIKVDDRNLSKLSLKEGLAVAYDGSTKSKDWCILEAEEPMLVRNPRLAWTAAQFFPILLSGQELFNWHREALSISSHHYRVLLLLML